MKHTNVSQTFISLVKNQRGTHTKKKIFLSYSLSQESTFILIILLIHEYAKTSQSCSRLPKATRVVTFFFSINICCQGPENNHTFFLGSRDNLTAWFDAYAFLFDNSSINNNCIQALSMEQGRHENHVSTARIQQNKQYKKISHNKNWEANKGGKS